MSGVANEFETIARYKKARKIADVLNAAGVSADDLDFSDETKNLAVALARVNEPSDVTWELVKYLIREGR